MSKLHAQMALLGTIDQVVCNAKEPETVKMVESFLPGTTGIGQRGWYRELKHFLNNKELAPRDAAGNKVERSGPVTFPSYDQAIEELKAGDEQASPAVRARALYACTILSHATKTEKGIPDIEGWTPPEHATDPLDDVMPALVGEMRTTALPPVPGITSSASSGNPTEDLKTSLRRLTSRKDYVNLTAGLVRTHALDPELEDLLKRPVVCTGSLRKIDGQYCTLLTTNWPSPFTMGQIRDIIDPHNWPDLCDFFVSMTDQADIEPDTTRGWTRVLESVSGDKTQWQMQTALRFWNGVATPGDGIFVNYDLDNPRVNDCKLVEVDAGYLSATRDGTDPDSPVTIRTCKQVRIRGVSPTATAALGCGFGWGDAMSQMFKVGAAAVQPDRPHKTEFTESVERDVVNVTDTNVTPADDEESDKQIAEAADEAELLKGWRGAIIEAMRLQLTNGIDKAQTLGSEFAIQWSDGDGFSLEDVKKFGADSGQQMTDYVSGIFEAAAAALQPQTDDAPATGGND